MKVTLIKPGSDPIESVSLDFAGDGVVVQAVGVKTIPHHFDTNQEAKEFIVMSTYALMASGWRIFTGDGITA